jgi:hypothetical protein
MQAAAGRFWLGHPGQFAIASTRRSSATELSWVSDLDAYRLCSDVRRRLLRFPLEVA